MVGHSPALRGGVELPVGEGPRPPHHGVQGGPRVLRARGGACQGAVRHVQGPAVAAGATAEVDRSGGCQGAGVAVPPVPRWARRVGGRDEVAVAMAAGGAVRGDGCCRARPAPFGGDVEAGARAPVRPGHVVLPLPGRRARPHVQLRDGLDHANLRIVSRRARCSDAKNPIIDRIRAPLDDRVILIMVLVPEPLEGATRGVVEVQANGLEPCHHAVRPPRRYRRGVVELLPRVGVGPRGPLGVDQLEGEPPVAIAEPLELVEDCVIGRRGVAGGHREYERGGDRPPERRGLAED
mmetsp:Transcript_38355/g.121131  ORF Transcript_38355/g.121131 Transcript_38355/m.121131 type:complete len:294 (+) Transcript_38355:3466-4347(+)